MSVATRYQPLSLGFRRFLTVVCMLFFAVGLYTAQHYPQFYQDYPLWMRLLLLSAEIAALIVGLRLGGTLFEKNDAEG